MKNLQLESNIEKFLFLNFSNGYDVEEALKIYFDFSEIEQIIRDKDNVIKYLNTKNISNRRKEILILNCVNYNFFSNDTTPLLWVEKWLLPRIESYIDKS